MQSLSGGRRGNSGLPKVFWLRRE